LKTGHTEGAGYGITVSAKQGDRRLILVVNGLSGTVERAKEAEFLLQYGFLQFTNKLIAKEGTIIEEIPVWYGAEKKVNARVAQHVEITVPKTDHDKVSTYVRYQSPLMAPVSQGAMIGELVLRVPNMPDQIIPLVAAQSIEKSSVFGRLVDNMYYYLGQFHD
jgi:D-alanyl-D-alanine carboxypeptidase (penicillin-binding protein 5/6)